MENPCGDIRGTSDCDSSQEAVRLGEVNNSHCQPAVASTSGEKGEISEESDTESVHRRTRKSKRSACRRDSVLNDSPLQPHRKRTRLLNSESENSSSDTSEESDLSSRQSASPSSSQETGGSAEELHASTHEPSGAFTTEKRGEGPGESITSSGQQSRVCTNEWREVESQEIEASFRQPNATVTNERGESYGELGASSRQTSPAFIIEERGRGLENVDISSGCTSSPPTTAGREGRSGDLCTSPEHRDAASTIDECRKIKGCACYPSAVGRCLHI
jgi:hypothetical protein